MVNLGALYSKGLGGIQDNEKAFALFKRAAEKGDYAAQYNLAEYYRAGLAIPRDIDKALYWYDKSAHQGNVKAMEKLSRFYQYGYKHIPANKALSEQWAKKAEAAREKERNDAVR